ncbi:hypothetical protein FPQ18DRAFT_323967, partial [Pyronema domesticum]
VFFLLFFFVICQYSGAKWGHFLYGTHTHRGDKREVYVLKYIKDFRVNYEWLLLRVKLQQRFVTTVKTETVMVMGVLITNGMCSGLSVYSVGRLQVAFVPLNG